MSKENSTNSVAQKVLYLFAHRVNPITGKPYSYNEVEVLSGGKIKNSWLSKVARSEVKKPSLDALTALTDFFKVDALFWLRPLEEGIKEKPRTEQSTPSLQRLTLRASVLPEEDQEHVAEYIEFLLKKRQQHPRSKE